MKVVPKPKKQIYAFIDSQNLNLGIQKQGWKMDWKKFRAYLSDIHGVTNAYMFIGYVPEFEPMYEQLHDSGYKVVLKPTFDMTKPHPEMLPESNGARSGLDEMQGEVEPRTMRQGKYSEGVEGAVSQQFTQSNAKQNSLAAGSGDAPRPTKGNIDADLVLWAMKEMPNYHKAVVVSGDGDFYCLVEYLAGKKRLHKLLTPNEQYSNLYNRYQQYIEVLGAMRKQLAYRDRRRKKR